MIIYEQGYTCARFTRLYENKDYKAPFIALIAKVPFGKTAVFPNISTFFQIRIHQKGKNCSQESNILNEIPLTSHVEGK